MKLAVSAVAVITIALLPCRVFAQQPIKTTPEPMSSRRREIRSEEAHDLLKAFLKVPGDDILQQNDFHYPDGTRYPAF